MSINIKNDRVHRLARDAAAALGTTQVAAIEVALTRLLAEHGYDPDRARAAMRLDVAHSILADYDLTAPRANPEISQVEDLYDVSTGMPG